MENAEEERAQARFFLKPQPRVSRAAFHAVFGAASLTVLALLVDEIMMHWVWYALMAYTLAAFLLFIARLARPPAQRVVEIRQDMIRWPASTAPRLIRSAKVDRITTFEAFRKGRHGLVRLGIKNRLPLALNTTMFSSIDEFDELVESIERVIGDRVPKEAPSREIPWLLFAVIVLLFSVHLSFYANGVDDVFRFLQWGALSNVLVMQGELFRLLSAALIHLSLMHLLVNVILLSATLPYIELALGRARACIILFVCAVGASVMTVGFPSAIATVGASGAIYGLLGVGAHRWFATPNVIPVRYRSMPGWILGGLVAADLVMGALNESIALSMHLGGFLSGVAVSWILLRCKLAAGWLQTAIITLVVTCVVASIGSVVVRNLDPDYSRTLARTFLTSPYANVHHVNFGAWWIAALPKVDRQDLVHARSRLTEAAKVDTPGILDTLATLSYRQERFDRAVKLEREALREAPTAFFASQLARFERAAGMTSASVRLFHREGRVCVAASENTQFEVHAIQLQADEIRSFIRARGVTDGACFKRPAAILPGREIITTLVDPSEVEGLEVDAWLMDSQVLSLP